jgi:hypothetical protein
MMFNLCNTWLLLVATLLATVRPVFVSNGWLSPLLATRGTSTETTEEREQGESQRESERESGSESISEHRKIRRTTTLLCGIDFSLMPSDARPLERSWKSYDLGPTPLGEHLLRWGWGTPLRI